MKKTVSNKRKKKDTGSFFRKAITLIAILNLILLFVFDYRIPGVSRISGITKITKITNITSVITKIGQKRGDAEGATDIEETETVDTDVAEEDKVIFEYDNDILVYNGSGKFSPKEDVTVKNAKGEELNKEFLKAKVTGERNKEIVYTYQDENGLEGTQTRLLKLEDYSGPIIVLTGDLPTIEDDDIGRLPELFQDRYTATDGFGHDITKDVKIAIEPTTDYNSVFRVFFKVTNVFGDTANSESKALVDFRVPHMKLSETNIKLQKGSTFDAASYVKYAVDWSGKNLMDRVDTEGSVDTDTVGNYEVNYSVTNEDGQTVGPKLLKVQVIE